MGPIKFLLGIGVVCGGGWVWFNWDDPACSFAAGWLVLFGLFVIMTSFTRSSWPRS